MINPAYNHSKSYYQYLPNGDLNNNLRGTQPSISYDVNNYQSQDQHKENKQHKKNSKLEWAGCIAASLLLFVGLSAGVNKLTKGGANSILQKFNNNLDKNLKGNKVYKKLNDGISGVADGFQNLKNKIPNKYKHAMMDKEFGNRRPSSLSSEFFQAKSDLKSEFGEEIYNALKKSVNASVKDNKAFNAKDWVKNINPEKIAQDKNTQEYVGGVLNNLKNNKSEMDKLSLLSDKYFLLKKSDKMSFLPRLLTKGLLLTESVTCNSLPLKASMATVNKMALPMAFALLGVAPTMKKTLDSDAPVHKKVNTFMKDFVINNAMGIMAFSYASKIINTVTGLKTLGYARDASHNLLKNSGKLVKATEGPYKMKFYDYPLKAAGRVLGFGQGYEFKATPKGIVKGAAGLAGGLGLRFLFAATKIQNALLYPVNKTWDLVFGKPINLDEQDKAQEQRSNGENSTPDLQSMEQQALNTRTNLNQKAVSFMKPSVKL